jgi:hypothetical protein
MLLSFSTRRCIGRLRVSEEWFKSSLLACSGAVIGIGIVIVKRNGKMFVWRRIWISLF